MSGKIALIFFFISFLLISATSVAQVPGDILDFNRIPQKAVRELVSRENVRTANDFQHIATACYRKEDSLNYLTDVKTYVVKAGIGNVWEKYTNISPRNAWTGQLVKFGFLFSRPKNKFIYAENANEPIRVGNIIYVNLSLLKGLKNMGVAFEITRLDEPSKTICFCYLRDGVSQGSQEISFSEMSNGDTMISHVTHYKSRSAFRDRELYPIFHAKFVGEFHQNVLRQIVAGS